jgi:putative transposase
MILGLQQGLKADGIEVSLVKLCEWFGVAQRTVYYRSHQRPAQAAGAVCEAYQGHDRREPVIWQSHGG